MFFFFKQKTAYEMLRSLVGSEMCIRDSVMTVVNGSGSSNTFEHVNQFNWQYIGNGTAPFGAVSYTHLTLPTIYSV